MLKIGDFFQRDEDLRASMQENLGIRFSQKGWIPHIPLNPDSRDIRHPNVSAAKHIFYNSEFPTKGRWNEFAGISKAEAYKHCLETEWLYEATNVIHEILSPTDNPAMPGANKEGYYEPFFDLTKKMSSPTKRLIFGQFRDLTDNIHNTYIFLGLYEYDKKFYDLDSNDYNDENIFTLKKDLNECKKVEPYKIDENSFPKDEILRQLREQPDSQQIDNVINDIQSGLVTYKHQVWTRIADQWPL